MTLNKLLLYSPLAVLAVVGAGYGYLWYDARQQVDRIVQTAAPFADVRYDAVRVSPGGSIAVTGVKILPQGQSDDIRIDSIRLQAPSILSWFGIKKAVQHGRLPPSLALTIDNIDPGPYWDFAAGGTPAGTGAGAVEGCGKVKAFGPEEWQAMGYRDIKLDLGLDYEYDEPQRVLKTALSVGLQDMASLTLDLRLAVGAAGLAWQGLQQSPPKLAGLQLTFKDASLNERVTRFCTQQSGLSVEDYVAGQVRSLVEALDRQGVTLSGEMIEALRRYLRKADHITVALAPKLPLAGGDLQGLSPQDMQQLLNLSVVVNQVPVKDLAIALREPPALAASAPPPGGGAGDGPPPAGQASAAPPAKAPAPPRPEKAYSPVPVADIASHIGRMAIIRTAAGKEHRGKLEALKRDSVRLGMRMPGGTAALNIRLDSIDALLIQK